MNIIVLRSSFLAPFGPYTHISGLADGRVFFYNEHTRSGAVGHANTAGKIVTDGVQGPNTFGDWTIIAAL
jgi:hypothetical protein